MCNSVVLPQLTHMFASGGGGGEGGLIAGTYSTYYIGCWYRVQYVCGVVLGDPTQVYT